jgi:hypothetical protein
MQTDCTPDLFGFAAVQGREVAAVFDGGNITSDVGALSPWRDRACHRAGRSVRGAMKTAPITYLGNQRTIERSIDCSDRARTDPGNREEPQYRPRRSLLQGLYWSTRDIWSSRRHVVAKAEHTRGEANLRFVGTSEAVLHSVLSEGSYLRSRRPRTTPPAMSGRRCAANSKTRGTRHRWQRAATTWSIR